MKGLIKNLLILFMWYPLRGIVAYLPLSVTAAIGKAGGYLLYAMSREKRRFMADEFRLSVPSASAPEITRFVRGSFVNYCLSEIEVLLYPSLNREFIDRVFVIEGRDHLDAALAKGKGVLLFQAHFGAFQMTMPAIGYLGYSMNQISASAAVWKEGVDSHAHRKMFDIKAKCEYALPVKHISVRGSLRPVFNALKRNEIVGITVDGGGGKKVVPLRFLGRQAFFLTGSADLAVSTGAVVIPAFITTGPGLRHRLILHPPLSFEAGSDKDESRTGILREFTALLETYVRRHPDHYGYTLGLRRHRAPFDVHPFFADYNLKEGLVNSLRKVNEYAQTKQNG